MRVGELMALVRDVPDFPEPGVVFKDITPLLADPVALTLAHDQIAEPFVGDGVDVVAGIEARGFMLGPPVAERLGVGFVPLRKAGKLPWRTRSVSYDLEYGRDTMEVHADAIAPSARVLIVDDVLATGGTAGAAGDLVANSGGAVVGVAVLLELVFLGGRQRLKGHRVHSVLQSEGEG
jgi:adenine phosphoribosyltransferase